MTVEQQNLTALFQAHVDPDTTPAAYTANISSLTSYDNYNLFGKRFLSDYDAKFGRYPELDIAASSTWEASPDYTTEERDKNEKQRQGFEEFINTHAIPASNETCTEGFWVYHISDKGGGVPEYRDVLTYDDFPPFKPMRAANIAPFAKLVDITVPIGAITYNSVISKVMAAFARVQIRVRIANCVNSARSLWLSRSTSWRTRVVTSYCWSSWLRVPKLGFAKT